MLNFRLIIFLLGYGTTLSIAIIRPLDLELHPYGLQATVSLGTPGQDFNVILDTNVGGFWIPSINCDAKTESSFCESKNLFTPKESVTFIGKLYSSFYMLAKSRTFYVTLTFSSGISTTTSFTYLKDKITVELAYDKFVFGPHYSKAVTGRNILFGMVDKLPPSFVDNNVDGVLGLGQYSQDNFDSPILQLMEQGVLTNPIVSIFVPKIYDVISAIVSVGSEDFGNCQPVEFLPEKILVANRNWAINVSGVFPGMTEKSKKSVVSLGNASV